MLKPCPAPDEDDDVPAIPYAGTCCCSVDELYSLLPCILTRVEAAADVNLEQKENMIKSRRNWALSKQHMHHSQELQYKTH